LSTNVKGDIPMWGEAWYAPNAITNIFSFAKMADKYCIATDSAVEKAFTVHLLGKKVQFEQNENGLYAYTPKKFERFQFMSSLDKNKQFFKTNQFERAKRARELYHAIGTAE
jgi:hypothetical protein